MSQERILGISLVLNFVMWGYIAFTMSENTRRYIGTILFIIALAIAILWQV